MVYKIVTMLTAMLLVVMPTIVAAHATLYPHIPKVGKQGDPHQVLSWHTHIVYNLANDTVARALDLRERTAKHFEKWLGPECEARFDEGRLCMIRDHDFHEILTVGPFVAGEWSMFVPHPYKTMVVEWLTQNRGEFSLLVHPNSGWEFDDHTIWAQWTGETWPLNTSPDILGDPTKQSNEFGHQRGDEANMVCIRPGGVLCPATRCADPEESFYYSWATCCPGSVCRNSFCQEV